jgi:hypothetical protein
MGTLANNVSFITPNKFTSRFLTNADAYAECGITKHIEFYW